MKENYFYSEDVIRLRWPKQYKWQPKEDITAYELALCISVLLPVRSWHDWEYLISALPENARRHFEEVGQQLE